MKKRILIRAFTARRDVAYFLLLAEVLKLKGYDVIISSLRQFERTIKLWKPHVIIYNVPSKINSIRKLAKDSKLVLIPGEGAETGIYSIAGIIERCKMEIKSDDLNFFWNEKSRQELFKLIPNLKKENNIICGNPKLDLIKYFPYKKKKRKKLKIGLVSRFPTINQHSGVPYVIRSLLPQRNDMVNNYTISAVLGFKTAMSLISRILKETEFDISIRPHPLESVEGYTDWVVPEISSKDQARIEINKSLCSVEWLHDIDIIISPTSTSLFECYLLDIPVISFDQIAKTKKINMQESSSSSIFQNATIMPKTPERLIANLKKDLKKRKNKKFEKYLCEFHKWPRNFSATIIIANSLELYIKRTEFKKGFFLPKFIIKVIDYLSFKKNMIRNKLHWNCNYHQSKYESPGYLKKITVKILDESI